MTLISCNKFSLFNGDAVHTHKLTKVREGVSQDTK